MSAARLKRPVGAAPRQPETRNAGEGLPHIGEHVTVAFFGATVHGVIGEIDEHQRRLCVLTEEGEAITFTLSRATGQFVAESSSSGNPPGVP